MEQNKYITFHYPQTLVFGPHSLKQFATDYLKTGYSRLYIVTVASVMDQLLPVLDTFKSNGISFKINYSINNEPTFANLDTLLSEAKTFNADSIAGIGGGSVMDVAKLVAALVHSGQSAKEITGNGLLKARKTWLTCIPTTSGTGSEVSPNAILLDEKDNAKKGIISPFLVPDSAYIDPLLTLSVPPAVTAYTGIDALTHCIEAYINKHAHPMADTMALDGIKLISKNLKKAVNNGTDTEARSNLALGSVYGGMCLGPVNTAAVHALAYPLGSEFKIPHGLSNAVLLPYIMEFNLTSAEKKYAAIALAMGADKGYNDSETAQNGIALLRDLMQDCNVPITLSAIGIPESAIPSLAKSALNVQRLLKNNPREVTYEDALGIYNIAFK
jgi:alcohol dehydrogenase class IV